MAVGHRRHGERNKRLREAMYAREVSFADLAKVAGKNVKTAQRWVYEGRYPRPVVAAAIAQFLGIDANWLWPQRRAEVNPELINLYANIAEVPLTVWTSTARAARIAIEIATDALPALPHNLASILAAQADNGVPVRLCLGATVQPTIQIDGAATRVHPSWHMVSIYRFDDEMIVWLNRPGPGPEHQAPVLHLRHSEDSGVFDYYRLMFARLWQGGETVTRDGKDWYRAAV